MVLASAGKRQTDKQQRRDRLYEAALALFREQGYEATTIDQIARRAGVAKGTFFNYFATKDAILRSMGEREIGRLSAASLGEGSPRRPSDGASPIGNLKRFVAALATSIERDRELVRLIFSKGISVAELMCGSAAGFSVQPTAALMLRQAQHQGEVNALLNPDLLAAALDALYLQQLVRWCEADPPYPLAERLTGVLDLLMLGIAAR